MILKAALSQHHRKRIPPRCYPLTLHQLRGTRGRLETGLGLKCISRSACIGCEIHVFRISPLLLVPVLRSKFLKVTPNFEIEWFILNLHPRRVSQLQVLQKNFPGLPPLSYDHSSTREIQWFIDGVWVHLMKQLTFPNGFPLQKDISQPKSMLDLPRVLLLL